MHQAGELADVVMGSERLEDRVRWHRPVCVEFLHRAINPRFKKMWRYKWWLYICFVLECEEEQCEVDHLLLPIFIRDFFGSELFMLQSPCAVRIQDHSAG
eukprot:548821-Hanusia_phi.AAC.2